MVSEVASRLVLILRRRSVICARGWVAGFESKSFLGCEGVGMSGDVLMRCQVVGWDDGWFHLP